MKRIYLLTGCVAFALGGCAEITSKNAISAQSAYNNALVNSNNQELLLNIVRLRYGEYPTFVEITSMSHNNNIKSGSSFGFNKTIMGAMDGKYPGSMALSLSPSYENLSGASYGRLAGKEYVKKFMTPISFPVVTSLIQSGWSLEEVFNLCIERINDLYNADTADGPVPEIAPEYESFAYFAHLLDELHKQPNHLVYFNQKPSTNFSKLYMQIKEKAGYRTKAQQVKQLAGLDTNKTLFEIKDNFLDQDSESLVVQCRTLLGVLYFASKGVEVPQLDIDGHVAGGSKDRWGKPFDWKKVCTRFHVAWSVDCPKNAYVACEYRGTWFYIADDDIQSKNTFSLIMQLMFLQSSQYNSSNPLLVVTAN